MRFWVALVSALAILGVAVVDLRGTSAGELSMVHRHVLEDSGDCDSCHGGWFQSMSEACLECHESIEQQLERGHGLHGAIDPMQAQACALCHSEHHGPTFQPTNVQSFVLAVSTTPEEFDHAVIGWPMAGKHLELDCTECHANADAAPLAEGTSRFLGLDRDCAGCHEDSHEGALASISCADCHQQMGFDQPGFVDHERSLHLTGGHASLECRKCHWAGGEHSLETLAAGKGGQDRTCLACHESPHERAFVGGFARSIGSSRGTSCVACHTEEHESFRSEAIVLGGGVHAYAGFELTSPHDDVTCDRCHPPDRKRFGRRYPGRGADECVACHEDPHGGQFDQGRFAEQGCIACHERQHFEPHAFGVEEHALSSLELSGAHLEADCHACHEVPSPGEPRRFEGTEAGCEVCHDDAHEGFFEQALARIEPTPEGTCEDCHLTTTFAEVSEETFDHGPWTGFALRGAHAQSDCESCHLNVPEPDLLGRSFGRVADTFGKYRNCESCHEDPHEGRFDSSSLPRRVQGRASCARCHQESSFRSLFGEFEHGRWTGFRLDGVHGEEACSACHERIQGASLELASGVELPGRSLGAARGASCADCHQNPHGDQFDQGIPVRCESCHAGALGFDDLLFHHDRDTRFRLGQAHRDLACTACHEPRVQTGAEFVRYRGLGRECTDCHGVHMDELKTGMKSGG